ncbi:hypothetical protein SporoP37_00375 [Sporosarcina sp. P37]|uniref:hypothetical protein n=1 Tax=unclassified Sporosarcina TaxID=2647733 RepID=UPI000A17E7D3|nr:MULTISPECIES: hypothetical protein [unclassified Sporosarcina]ARK23295.1 hypothetical protein SporoP37_00375 [Sporosarcina sp. P37]PID19547.1 hypothetical protein CSV62_03325 [Sporosarcina sp. P35]
MNKTLREQLIEKGLVDTKINKSDTKSRKNGTNSDKRIQKERLSERDLAELMGVNRDTYRRVGGAIRRK